MKKIFILDDEMTLFQPLLLWFEEKGYSAYTFQTTEDFKQSSFFERPELAIMNTKLSGKDSRTLCSILKQRYQPVVPIILLSEDQALTEEFSDCHQDALIKKPVDLASLTNIVKSFLKE